MCKSYPSLCLVGPMLGGNPGWVVSQGEVLAQFLTQEGYPVRLTSTLPNRYLRLGDMVRSLITWRRQIDVIVLMVFSGPAFGMADAAGLIARRLGKPLVLWLHGGSLPAFGRHYSRWARRVYRRGDAIVSPSGYLADATRQLGFAVRVIPNLISLDRYPYCHRAVVQPRLLWMRTFHDIYHPEMAVETLDYLRDAYPQAMLTMAGQEKGKLEAVKALVRQKGLAERVRFAGFLDMRGKQQAFAQHDIYLNTNRVDNMPVSVVEAAAFGLPIVATAVGGIPHLLTHEQTALFVPDGDAVGMAAAVHRLLAERGLAGRLSENGRLLAESCSWPQVKQQWGQVFQEVQTGESYG
ncbi:MAG: glycosyltransferase family 4 protein [Anaerolineae bacterium]